MTCAYVSLIYGDSQAFLDSVVFAASLRSTDPRYALLLLYADDVPRSQLQILSKYYDDLIRVSPLQIKDGIISDQCPPRLNRIFDKTHALTLTQYERLLICDSDMVVCRNIDHLFEFHAPAAMALDADFIGSSNVLLPRDRAWERYTAGQSYVNAGIMLLCPNERDFLAIRDGLADGSAVAAGCALPDQTLFSGFYAGKWHSIPYEYNFRPQDIVSPYAAYLKEIIIKTAIDDVFVVHYAGSHKPVQYLQRDGSSERIPFADVMVSAIEKFREGAAFSHADSEVQRYVELTMLWIRQFERERFKLIAEGVDLSGLSPRGISATVQGDHRDVSSPNPQR